MLDPVIVSVMLALGTVLGFIGFGGGGFITALLILMFHVPVHLAFGTGLGAMFVTGVVGSWSHLREGNVEPVAAIEIGVAGVLGAYLGGGLALATGATQLKTFAGLTLIFNAGLIYLRTRVPDRPRPEEKPMAPGIRWRVDLPQYSLFGALCGLASGFFAIGVAPWIQLGLLVMKGMDLRRTIGTTMFALATMSFSGAVRFAQGGQVEPWLLASVVIGLSSGSFVGAKFTRRAPRWLVRSALIATPMSAGTLLLLIPSNW